MTDTLMFHSGSAADTERFGHHLGLSLADGLVVALDGQLGSGKTCLVRGVCAGLGIRDALVNSPTFVLMQVYDGGRLPVFHFDTYRLSDSDEFLAIGADEYLYDDACVCLIEWADTVRDVLPADHLAIRMSQTGAESREFAIQSYGPKSDRVVASIRESGLAGVSE